MRLGIRGKLFALSLTIIGITVLVLNLYFTSALRASLEERIAADLTVRARLIARELELHLGIVNWQGVAEEAGRQALVRATLMDREGNVLGDSDVLRSRVGRAENYRDQPEVRDALDNRIGISRRATPNSNYQLLFVAVPSANPNASIVRLAQSLEPIDRAVARARELLLWGTALAVVLAGALSSIGSYLLSRSIRELRTAAEGMVRDISVRTRIRGRDEVGALGRTLDELAENLSNSLDRLARERDQLEAILETLTEGVLVTNPEGRIILANRALRVMFGTTGQLVGRIPIESIRSAELSELIAQVSRTRAVRSTELEFDGILPRRVRVQAAPLSGAAQRGVVAVFSDQTELYRLESVRRDFVANVSHELRTPIAAMMAAAETLESGALRDPDSARQFVQIISRHGQRLREIVEDLLALNRLDAQHLELQPETIDVASFLREIVELHSLAASRHRTSVVVEPAPAGLTLIADRRAVEHVLSNLVDNAVKYAPDATVHLTVEVSGSELAFSVRDTGPGIEKRHLSRLFERFYRVDKGRSRDVGGTGLGLSIVKHLTEALGGKVTVESVIGVGSTFTVRLPRSPRVSPKAHAAAADPTPSDSDHDPLPYQS